jgi:hypothetical protein
MPAFKVGLCRKTIAQACLFYIEFGARRKVTLETISEIHVTLRERSSRLKSRVFLGEETLHCSGVQPKCCYAVEIFLR